MMIFPISGSVYGCIADVTTFGGNLTLVSVTGRHQGWRGNNQVEMVDVRDERSLNGIPANIGQFFPNTNIFQWIRGNLTTLVEEDLRQFNLKALILTSNNIVSLDGNVFSNSVGLIQIDFANNNIRHTAPETLRVINSLQLADFSANPCINKNARTPIAVRDLIIQLNEQCPPLALTTTSAPATHPTTTNSFPPMTTKSDQCDIRCSINDEMDALDENVLDLNRVIDSLINRINELERQVRELNANTGS
jgi:Leucine rich repeat